MTGYGKAVAQLPNKKITAEIRALNSKNLDLNLRLPQAYREQELPLRQRLAKKLLRGKVDVALHLEQIGTSAAPELNLEVVEKYMRQMAKIEGVLLDNSGHKMKLLEIATGMPEVFTAQNEEVDESAFAKVQQVVDEALANLMQFRKEEGDVLEKEFNFRIGNIHKLLEEVKSLDETRLAAVRARLEKSVEEIKERVDQNRFEQELIYYLEKYDITEEKVRLANHLNYFQETMNLPESQGKKLGFISQEIGREINTIGSKANDSHMQQIVVQMKDELEKIKEQMLNVL